jgi:REP element-mobilizing transposase RayT
MRNLGIEQISFFSEISDEYEFEIQEMEVEEDHVHILISFHPKYSIGQVVRTLKSISARELFREFLESRDGCGAGSCGRIAISPELSETV